MGYSVALQSCDVLIAFVAPHDHPATGADWPLWEDVVDNSEDRGRSRVETIEENIPNVSVEDLSPYLLNEDHRKISWLCMKPGEKNHRLQVFYSQSEKPLKMTPGQSAAVEVLHAQTWKWGKIYVIRNEKALDLIVIELFGPLGSRTPENFFDVENGEIEAFKVKSLSDNRQKKPKGKNSHKKGPKHRGDTKAQAASA